MGRPRKITTVTATEAKASANPSFDMTSMPSTESYIRQLEAALRPFAKHGTRLRMGDRRGAPRKMIYDQGESVLTLGDFDVARRLIFGEGPSDRIAEAAE